MKSWKKKIKKVNEIKSVTERWRGKPQSHYQLLRWWKQGCWRALASLTTTGNHFHRLKLLKSGPELKSPKPVSSPQKAQCCWCIQEKGRDEESLILICSQQRGGWVCLWRADKLKVRFEWTAALARIEDHYSTLKKISWFLFDVDKRRKTGDLNLTAQNVYYYYNRLFRCGCAAIKGKLNSTC